MKVYSKKVGYLFQDCNDALVKVKQVTHASYKQEECAKLILSSHKASQTRLRGDLKVLSKVCRPSKLTKWTFLGMARLQLMRPSPSQTTSTAWTS